MRETDTRDGAAGVTRRRSFHHSKNSDSPSLASRIALSTSELACSIMGRSGTTDLSKRPTLRSLSKASNSLTSHCSSSRLSEVATPLASRVKSTSTVGESLRSMSAAESPNGEFEEFFASEGVLTRRFANRNGNVGTLLLKICQDPAAQEPGLASSNYVTPTVAQPEDATRRSSAWTGIVKARGSASRGFKELSEDITLGLDQDHRAHNRLKLVLGHISRTGQYIPGNETTFASSPDQSDALLQSAITGTLALPGHLGDGSVREHDSETVLRTGSSRAPFVLANAAAAHEKHVYRMHSGLLDRSENQGPLRSAYTHCSWASCNQRPKSSVGPQTSTNMHMAYMCPHDDCGVHFHCYRDWAEHVAEPHQDVMDEDKSRTPISSETWFSPRLHQRRRW